MRARLVRRPGTRARRLAPAVLAAALFLWLGLATPVPAASAELPPWTPPDPETLPDDAFGRAVRYGRDLVVHSSALIGRDAPDPAMRYAGNGLDCQSCHLDAGTKRFGLPLAGIWGVFPVFIGRENEVRTLEERINGCMERSMNGRVLPVGGAEMKAMLAYIRFVSAGVPVGASAAGRGAPTLAVPDVAANPEHGAAIFQEVCTVCHQPDGQGKRLAAAEAAAEKRRYQFPPLWGPDSYNDGAGMARSITAANFISANMPLGTDSAHPALAAQDAFDVAAYVDSQERPHKADTENDYPDRSLKPVDAPFPPFLGPFPPAQHRTGPWKPMQQWMKDNAAVLRAAPGPGATPQ